MKKTIITFALVLAVSVVGMKAAEARWGNGGGHGCGNGGRVADCSGSRCIQGSNEDSKAIEDFQIATTDLRQQMFNLRQEYFEIMNQENPEKEEAARIWSEIFDLQTQIQEEAEAAGIQKGFGMRGRNFSGSSVGKTPCGGSGPANCWKNQSTN